MFYPGRLRRFLPVVAWMLTIFAASSRSSVPQTSAIPTTILSIAGHLFVFAVLAILITWTLQHDIQSFARRAGIAWFVSTLYGISDEFHQSFVPGRYATAQDVLTDSVGAALGLALLWMYKRKQRRMRVSS